MSKLYYPKKPVKAYQEGGAVEKEDDGGSYMKVAKPQVGDGNSATAYMSTPGTRARSKSMQERVRKNPTAFKDINNMSDKDWEDSSAEYDGSLMKRALKEGGIDAANTSNRGRVWQNDYNAEKRKKEGK